MVEIPGAWQLIAKAQRFPVAYLETAELFRRLDLDPSGLKWQALGSDPGTAQPASTADRSASLTGAIAEAKRKLAESLGIASEKIEITIRL